MHISLFLVVICALVESYGELVPVLSAEEEDMRISLAKCISEASDQNFKPFEVITISLAPILNDTSYYQSTALDGLLLPELFDKNKWTLLVKQPSWGRPSMFQSHTYLTFTKSDSYVIQLNDFTKIENQLHYLKRHPSWNPHAKFIIILTSYYENEGHLLEFITRRMWWCDILNGVIILADKNKAANFNIYSWFPFSDGSCGNKFNKLLHIDSCYDGVMTNNTDWFPNKLPPKMNNCTIHVRTLDYPPYIVKPQRVGNTSYYHIRKGLEAQLMNLVASTCNVYMQYEIVKNDSVGDFAWPANQSTGLMGALKRGDADIAVASLSATWQRHLNLDSTSAYFQDSVGFCVPHSDETSQWEKLSGIMDSSIWFGVIITVAVFIVIIKFLSHQKINPEERPIYADGGNVAMKILAISIGNAVNLQPKSNQVRFFLMMWIIFSLQFDTAYQTYLMSALTNLEYSFQIRTVDDILDSDLEVLFRPDDMKYFVGSSTTRQSQEIVARWKVCNDLDECLRRTAYKKDSVIAASRLYIQYAKSSYISKTGLPLLFCIQEQIVSFPVVAYMRHGFPLQHKFDNIISSINSAGYLQRFEQDLFQEKNFTGGFKNTSTEEDFLDVDVKNKLLTFGHIKPIFMMLFGGYVISSFAFLMELFLYKYAHRLKTFFRHKIG